MKVNNVNNNPRPSFGKVVFSDPAMDLIKKRYAKKPNKIDKITEYIDFYKDSLIDVYIGTENNRLFMILNNELGAIGSKDSFKLNKTINEGLFDRIFGTCHFITKNIRKLDNRFRKLQEYKKTHNIK